ncbi:MAG: hypothetical protein LBK59_01735 [Bifidobacteriaceae bacterium]|jgi:hypothetical protein|nr:hypothetical protein [Bifidobacteriaceae bacterium]
MARARCGAWWGVLTGLTFVSLAGCTEMDDDVATLATQVVSPDPAEDSAGASADSAALSAVPAATQHERTEALVQCLLDKSIGARVDDLPDGQAVFDFGGSAGPVALVAEDGSGMVTDDPEAQELWEAADSEGRPLLWIGGADRTDEYLACVEESGYTPPVMFPDPAEEDAVKQLQVDLTNDWIACARENGLPNLADVPPAVVDGGTTNAPSAMLSLDTSEDTVREVLEACPPLDEKRFRDLADGRETGPANGVVGATISFEGTTPGAVDSPSDDEWERIGQLSSIINEFMQRQYQGILDTLAAEGITYQGPEIQWGPS